MKSSPKITNSKAKVTQAQIKRPMVELNEKNQPEIITEWIPISITDPDQIMSVAKPDIYMSGQQDAINIADILVEKD